MSLDAVASELKFPSPLVMIKFIIQVTYEPWRQLVSFRGYAIEVCFQCVRLRVELMRKTHPVYVSRSILRIVHSAQIFL